MDEICVKERTSKRGTGPQCIHIDSTYVHFADKVQGTGGASIVVHGKERKFMPKGNTLLVVIQGVHAVIDRVVLPFLLFLCGGGGSEWVPACTTTKKKKKRKGKGQLRALPMNDRHGTARGWRVVAIYICVCVCNIYTHIEA